MSRNKPFPSARIFWRQSLPALLVSIVASTLTPTSTETYAQTRTEQRPVARMIASSPASVATPYAPARIVASARAADGAVRASAADAVFASAVSIERRAFELINDARRANGETALVWDDELCRMARLHSQNMARADFFDHTGPDGMDMIARSRTSGVTGWRALRENIAYNQGFDDPAAFAVERWMKSTKHRTNILDAQLTRSGIGVAHAADGRVFFTQVFIMR